MKWHCIVCDADGCRTMDESGDVESFRTFKEADARAKAIATEAPGRDIFIYEMIAVAKAQTLPAETTQIPARTLRE